MIKKIDLSNMHYLTQDKIWAWCSRTFGKSGPSQIWNWHEQPSRKKFWIELNTPMAVTLWKLKWE